MKTTTMQTVNRTLEEENRSLQEKYGTLQEENRALQEKYDAMQGETREDVHGALGCSRAFMHEEWTALRIAVSLGYTTTVRGLLDRGARTVMEGNFSTAPYELAVEGRESYMMHYGMIPDWKHGKVQI